MIVIIIGLLVFILHDKILSKDDSSINNDNNVEELTDEKTIMNISLDSDIVKTAMDSFEKIVLQDDELYKEGGYDISSISNIDLLSTALANVDPKYIDYCTESSKKEAVSIDILNDLISKYVLGKKLTIEDIKKIGNDTNELFDFEVSGNGVKITGPCGALYGYEDYQARKVVGAELDGDYLYIYEKNAFARYIKNSGDESDLPHKLIIIRNI